MSNPIVIVLDPRAPPVSSISGTTAYPTLRQEMFKRQHVIMDVTNPSLNDINMEMLRLRAKMRHCLLFEYLYPNHSKEDVPVDCGQQDEMYFIEARLSKFGPNPEDRETSSDDDIPALIDDDDTV